MARRLTTNSGFGAYTRNFRAGSVPPQAVSSKQFRYVYDEFRGPISSWAVGGGAAAGTTGAVNQINTGGSGLGSYTIEQFILGAGQTIITPVLVNANGGIDIGADQTSTEGGEYIFGASATAATSGKLAFKARTDAAFFAKLTFSIEDVSGVNPFYFGFMKAGVAANATFATEATDYVTIAIVTAADPAVVKTSTRLNSGTATNTDTGITLADTITTTWEVDVDANGYVNFYIDGAQGLAEKGFRLDDGDWVKPFCRFLNAADLAGVVALQSFECGFQAR